MATGVKFNCFIGDLYGKIHDLLGTAGSTADTCKLVLTLTAPSASSNTVLSDLTQIASGHGYTTDGNSCANVGTNTAGSLAIVCTDVVWTSDGSFAAFRYVPMYNSTAAGKNLICYWDYGSTLTMTSNGDTFTADFGASTITAT